MKKALIIINRTAGMGQKAELEAALVHTLESQNFDAVIKYTKADDFEDIVLEHRETADLFIAAGGDGTLSGLVSILGRENIDTPVAVIPAGTVNDFARSNGLPLNPLTAAKELDTSVTKAVDLIKVNDTYALYLAAFGNFMSSFAKVSSPVKNKTGRAAYLWTGLKTLMKLTPYRISLKINTLELGIDSVLTLVSKNPSVGSLEKLIPEVKPDDGLLHILNVEPVNTREIAQLLYMAFKGRITEHPKVLYLTAEQVEIQACNLKEMNIDGDIYDYKDTVISVVKDGLKLAGTNKNTRTYE